MTDTIITAAICILLILFILCVVRAVQSKSVADRMVAVNIATSMTGVIAAAIAVLFGQDSYIDIAIVYVILSFLSVLVFTRVFIGTYRAKKLMNKEREANRID